MKKILSLFMGTWISISIYAQTDNTTKFINNVSIPMEQQLATLFSKLNFADVKTINQLINIY